MVRTGSVVWKHIDNFKTHLLRLKMKKEIMLNNLIGRMPALIQVIFIERVIKSVQASIQSQKEKDSLLLSEKEGGICEGR